MSLRSSRGDFEFGVRALQRVVDQGATVAIHNAMFDIEMARLMGLELRDANLWDTMYAAYLMRLEPQGLKALAYRWLGIKMGSYEDTVGDVGRDKQIDYLINVMCGSWPKPEDQIVTGNDGESKLYKPQRVEQRAQGILSSIFDDVETDVLERWKAVDKGMRQMVEARLGRMPFGTLADLSLHDAINYSIRDADATLRLYHALTPVLKKRDLSTGFGQRQPYVPERKDFMLIREEPDFYFAGDMHHKGYAQYRGCLCVNAGCWQSQTDYQIRQGHIPTPGIAIDINLKTRKLTENSFMRRS